MVGKLSVFDRETWTWRDATPEELKKQEAVDTLRYEGLPQPPEKATVERVEIDGKKYLVWPSNFGKIEKEGEISDELKAYIKSRVGQPVKDD